MPEKQDYLDWDSELTLEQVFAQSELQAHPELFSDGYIYLSRLEDEQGRSVLMYRDLNNRIAESAKSAQGSTTPICLTPAPYSLRTRINEYGGRPFWCFEKEIVFCNEVDQALYRQTLLPSGDVNKSAEIQRISPIGDNPEHYTYCYSDVHALGDDKYLAIIEKTEKKHADNTHFLGVLDANKPDAAPIVLSPKADFFSNLCVDSGRGKMAWVQWNHPGMPWDETQLFIADIDLHKTSILHNVRAVQLPTSASVCQCLIATNGQLFFSMDIAGQQGADNFWNIHQLDLTNDKQNLVRVTAQEEEFGYPHWQYGDARIVQADNSNLVAYATTGQGDKLYMIDQDTLAVKLLNHRTATLQHLSSDQQGRVIAICSTETQVADIAIHSLADDDFSWPNPKPPQLAANEISCAEHIEFQTSGNQLAYAYYYPPHNSRYQAPGPPPCLVMVHGGPTAKAYGSFDLQKQFWTQHGFAVLDVNHRGSSGYGRGFRDALYGNWGIIDTKDIVKAIDMLIAEGKADAGRICIRGKSAGGYAVLRALTEYPEYFKAGASYYGIGNLCTLAETTHKFEKFYTDRLIGEAYNPARSKLPESEFQLRSPINKLGELNSAMAIFQGLEDRIVPPTVADEIIATLNDLNLPYTYVAYPDEGHGFRQSKNNIDAWQKELNFYRTQLRHEYH